MIHITSIGPRTQSFLGTMFKNYVVHTDSLDLSYTLGKTHPMWILGIVFLYSAVKHLLGRICHPLAGNTWEGGVWTYGAEYCWDWGSKYFQGRKPGLEEQWWQCFEPCWGELGNPLRPEDRIKIIVAVLILFWTCRHCGHFGHCGHMFCFHLRRRRWQPRTLVVLVLLLQIVHGAIPPQVGLASPNKVLWGSVENSTGISPWKAASTGGTWRIWAHLRCRLLAVVVLWLLQLISWHYRT